MGCEVIGLTTGPVRDVGVGCGCIWFASLEPRASRVGLESPLGTGLAGDVSNLMVGLGGVGACLCSR